MQEIATAGPSFALVLPANSDLLRFVAQVGTRRLPSGSVICDTYPEGGFFFSDRIVDPGAPDVSIFVGDVHSALAGQSSNPELVFVDAVGSYLVASPVADYFSLRHATGFKVVALNDFYDRHERFSVALHAISVAEMVAFYCDTLRLFERCAPPAWGPGSVSFIDAPRAWIVFAEHTKQTAPATLRLAVGDLQSFKVRLQDCAVTFHEAAESNQINIEDPAGNKLWLIQRLRSVP